MGGALWLAVGSSVGASAIPLLALEFALALPMGVVTTPAVLLASICFRLTGCAGCARTAIEKG